MRLFSNPRDRMSRRACVLIAFFAAIVPNTAAQTLPVAGGSAKQVETSANGPESSQALDVHAAQNPVASLISVPFQNNTFIHAGPLRRTANVLVVEPVIPVKVSSNWNLITRWVTPVVYRPEVIQGLGSQTGLGNLQPEFYLSPTRGKLLWGIGPKLFLPTATDKTLGINKWGGGPAAAALTIKGPWVVGALINNVWAGSGSDGMNQLTLNPFIDFNLPGHWYIVSSEVITADWQADANDRWTVPVGAGIGRVFKLGSQAMNVRVQALNNVLRQEKAPSWQLQAQLQFLFPGGFYSKAH